MRITNILRTLVFLAASVLALLGVVSAEISVEVGDPEGAYSGFLLAGGDHGDPWPQVRSHIDPVQLLNIDGEQNGDGVAAFSINPQTGYPEVVWAWFDGGDYEIVLSRWNGSGWTDLELLTDNAVDDLDPAIDFAGDGKREVTWWRAGDPAEVWYLSQAPSEDWQFEERVTGVVEIGSWPDVDDEEGVTRVAYQDGADAATAVAVSTLDAGWQRETIASTSYIGPAGDGNIDVQIHSAGGTLWVDWIDDEGVMAYCSFDAASSWSLPESEPYSWEESIGETEANARTGARVRIRLQVCGQ